MHYMVEEICNMFINILIEDNINPYGVEITNIEFQSASYILDYDGCRLPTVDVIVTGLLSSGWEKVQTIEMSHNDSTLHDLTREVLIGIEEARANSPIVIFEKPDNIDTYTSEDGVF